MYCAREVNLPSEVIFVDEAVLLDSSAGGSHYVNDVKKRGGDSLKTSKLT